MPILRFQSPAVLAALVVLPILWLLWARACRRTEAARKVLSDGNGPPAGPRRADAWRGALRTAAIGALVVGLAGPSILSAGALSPARIPQVPVVFVLDVSASMAATDVGPDRLACACEAVRRICSLLPGARTALVPVSEDATVACPPTADRDAFLQILAQMRTNWMGAGGTRLAEGIRQAHDLIARDTGAGVIMLMSDGEDAGDPLQPLLTQMRRKGTLTHTVTLGSAEGIALKAVPVGAPSGAPVVTKAQPEQMAAWAAAGGGRAWAMTPAGSLLPTQAEEVVPRQVLLATAQRTGEALVLSPWFYLLAAALLLTDRLARAGR
jgi:Mg-chelatase subunit ChlD